jgi:hypothetical protein
MSPGGYSDRGPGVGTPVAAEPKALGSPLGRRSLRLGPYQFFALMAFSAWMSSACSATICFSRRWPSSKLAELLHMTDFEPSIFRAPLLKGGIRDAVLAAELLDASSYGAHLSTSHLPSQCASFRREGYSSSEVKDVAGNAIGLFRSYWFIPKVNLRHSKPDIFTFKC